MLLLVEGTPLNHSLFWKFQKNVNTTATPTELEDGIMEFDKTYHDDYEMGESELDNETSVTSQTEANDMVMFASEVKETVLNVSVTDGNWRGNETETSTDAQTTLWAFLNENDSVLTSHSNETDKKDEHNVTFSHDQEEITTKEVVFEKGPETVTYGSEKSYLTLSKLPRKTSTTQPSKINKYAASSVQTWSVEAYGNHRNSDVTKKNYQQ